MSVVMSVSPKGRGEGGHIAGHLSVDLSNGTLSSQLPPSFPYLQRSTMSSVSLKGDATVPNLWFVVKIR